MWLGHAVIIRARQFVSEWRNPGTVASRAPYLGSCLLLSASVVWSSENCEQEVVT